MPIKSYEEEHFYDIARELNISIITIFFVINGKAKEMRISDKQPP